MRHTARVAGVGKRKKGKRKIGKERLISTLLPEGML
jgi:hypothetical protein